MTTGSSGHVAAVGVDALRSRRRRASTRRRPPRRRWCACPAGAGVGTVVMKNCEPFVPWPPWMPALAIARMYGSVEGQLAVDLVVELVARTADALAERVAALEHELLDDAVEDHAVVERGRLRLAGLGMRPRLGAVGEADEVGDGLRRVVAEQVDADVAVVRVDGRDGGGNGHAAILPCAPADSSQAARRRGALTVRMPLAGWDSSPQPQTEVDMGLSRKRQRELKRLKRSAEELWDEQREAIEHASAVLRDARRQASNYAREEVGPRVRDAYEDNVRPAFETGFRGHATRGVGRARPVLRRRAPGDLRCARIRARHARGGEGSAGARCGAQGLARRTASRHRQAAQVRGTRPLHPDRSRRRRLRRHRLRRLADPARRRRPVDRGPRRGSATAARRTTNPDARAGSGARRRRRRPADRMLGADRLRAERLAVALRVGEPERRAAGTGVRRCRPARVHHRRTRHLPARHHLACVRRLHAVDPDTLDPRSTAARGTSRACSTRSASS